MLNGSGTSEGKPLRLALEDDPRLPGVTKLKGSDAYRIRIGDYRIVYLVNDPGHIVEIVRVAHRREVYL